MTLCTILVLVGLVLLVDGLFGFLRKMGIPLPPNIGAPIGFLLIVIGTLLNITGQC